MKRGETKRAKLFYERTQIKMPHSVFSIGIFKIEIACGKKS
jgi:hypothetical protein